jgi:hypothetical protein
MECSEIKKLISAHLDSELIPIEHQRLTDHLEVCADCRQFQRELIALRQAMAAAKDEMIPREADQVIIDRTINRVSLIKKFIGIPGGYYRIPRSVAWAAALLLMFLLGNTITDRLTTLHKTAIARGNLSESAMIQKIEMTQSDLVGIQTVSAKGIRH